MFVLHLLLGFGTNLGESYKANKADAQTMLLKLQYDAGQDQGWRPTIKALVVIKMCLGMGWKCTCWIGLEAQKVLHSNGMEDII